MEAIRCCCCCCCTNSMVPRGHADKIKTRTSLHHKSRVMSAKSSSPSSKSCSVGKVFEDIEMGIICYRDGKGELVCEGHDEGPRLQLQNSERQACQRRQRELQILQLLQLQIASDADFYHLCIHDGNYKAPWSD